MLSIHAHSVAARFIANALKGTSPPAIIYLAVLEIIGLIGMIFFLRLTRYFSTLAHDFTRKKTPPMIGKKMIFDAVTES